MNEVICLLVGAIIALSGYCIFTGIINISDIEKIILENQQDIINGVIAIVAFWIGHFLSRRQRYRALAKTFAIVFFTIAIGCLIFIAQNNNFFEFQ